MVKTQKISQYRERLDQTLASQDLVNEKTLAALVKNQLLRSPLYETEGLGENVLEKRTAEVSNFLEMLRSASMHEKEVPKIHSKQHPEWKLKQDTEDCRIMYREGPQGSPFHSLLVEGYMDAAMDVCLCVSWESSLYKKWWPQYSLPTFKIISCKCSEKVQTGEQISSVRLKLSWPLSDREAIVHYFEFEYFQDDLIIVLINSVSDLESMRKNLGGLIDDEAEKDMIRVDMIGGFALQKVTSDRSYFRTIMNMDIKLDFIPPSLINFISRQLVGNGFRLYQKAVTSVSKADGDFSRALGDPLYTRIRGALYSNNVQNGMLEPENLKNDVACILPNEHVINTTRADVEDTDLEETVIDQKAFHEIEEEEVDSSLILPKEHLIKATDADVKHADHSANESFLLCEPVTDQKTFPEIEEEEEIKESIGLEKNVVGKDHLPEEIEEKSHLNRNPKFFIRPAVEQALETLEKIISLVQNVGFSAQTMLEQSSVGKDARRDLTSSEENRVVDGSTGIEASNNEVAEKSSNEPSSSIYESRCNDLNSSARETNQNRIAPAASPEQNPPLPCKTSQLPLCSSEPEKTAATILEETNIKKVSDGLNGINDSSPMKKRKVKRHKKQFLCCLHFKSKRAVA